MPSKIISTIVLLYSFAGSVTKAQSVFIKAGTNYSYLKESSYGEPGMDHLFGIGKSWHLYRWIQFRTEVLISKSDTALKNRSILSSYYIRSFPYLPNEPITIRYYDLDIRLEYLEMPLLFTAQRSFRKNLSIGLELGYSLKFLRKDASKLTFLRGIESTDLTEKERQNFRFDYRVTGTGENYSYHGRGLCPTVGMYFFYSKFQIVFRYQVDYIDWVSSIVLGEGIPLNIFSLSMGYQL